MPWSRINPSRDSPPCRGCQRELKMPGCHDRCDEYKAWKKQLEAVNQKRKEYNELCQLTTRGRRYGK